METSHQPTPLKSVICVTSFPNTTWKMTRHVLLVTFKIVFFFNTTTPVLTVLETTFWMQRQKNALQLTWVKKLLIVLTMILPKTVCCAQRTSSKVITLVQLLLLQLPTAWNILHKHSAVVVTLIIIWLRIWNPAKLFPLIASSTLLTNVSLACLGFWSTTMHIRNTLIYLLIILKEIHWLCYWLLKRKALDI